MTSPIRLTAAALAACLAAAIPVRLTALQNFPATAASGSGFKVHGHWAIDVRNPDGTRISHQEFDNALQSDGRFLLGQLLSRGVSAGRWRIVLEDTAGDSPCTSIGVFRDYEAGHCGINDPRSGVGSSPLEFNSLTAGMSADGQHVVLTGTVTASQAGRIDRVSTYQGWCAPNVTSDNCNSPAGSFLFTSHTLAAAQGADAPVTVANGQIVQVSVTIGFCGSTGC